MALPTTGLTLHCRADRTNQLFTTKNGGGTGVHTGTPTDGNTVAIWDDEGDGVTDVCLSGSAKYRSVTPLMIHSCLDFDGSADAYVAYLQDASIFTPKAASNFLSASAFTVAFAFYPEAVASAAAQPYDNNSLLTNSGPWFGLHLRDNAGTYEVLGTNNDFGGHDVITLPGGDPGRTWIAVWRHGGGNQNLTVIDDAGTETSASPVATGDTGILSGTFEIGGRGGASTLFNGRISEFAIWNDEKTGTDLTDLKDYFKAAWLAPAGGGAPVKLLHLREQGMA